MPDQERMNYLFQRYLDHTETPEELEELMEIIEKPAHKAAIDELLATAQTHVDRTVQLNEEQSERLYENIWERSNSTPWLPTPPARRRRRMAMATAVVALLCMGGYWMFFSGNNQPAAEVATLPPVTTDVAAPVTNRATITLADGSTIALDSLNTLSQQSVQVKRTADGRLVYSGKADAVAYNTLTNPKGSQVIDITLADGSKVWLNAGSAITYPVAFTGDERKVTITGEAYFEIMPDKSKPFVVSKSNVKVEVLGTHFNVNAYDDEQAIKTTLLEGKVKVVNDAGSKQQEVVLKPGQQAVLAAAHSPLTIHHSPDLDQVMAWKNGRFEFNETDIRTVMKQVERWYDVEVVIEGDFTQHFNGSIQRKESASKVLSMLAKTGGLRFTIEGRKVIVKKY